MVNKLVVKSNDLIEARYKLNLNEQKIILYAVTMLDRTKDKFNIISLNVKEFTELIGTTTERYTEIREVVRELRKKEIIINTSESELITGWLSSIDYIKDSGMIELEFSEKLIPYLLQLKEKFTRYQIKNILPLKNKHSIRIYELMKQYQTIGHRTFNIDELKEILMLDDKYKEFKNFNRFVIKQTMEEINEYTDIDIDFELIKKGRNVVSIKYIIKPKDDGSYIKYLNENYNISEFKLKSGLENENFNAEQVIELFTIATEVLTDPEQEDLFEYIRLNYLHILKNKSVINRYSYLKKALEEDFAAARGQIKFAYNLG